MHEMHISRGEYIGGKTWLLWRTALSESRVVLEAAGRFLGQLARDLRLPNTKAAFEWFCKWRFPDFNSEQAARQTERLWLESQA